MSTKYYSFVLVSIIGYTLIAHVASLISITKYYDFRI